MGNHNPQQWLDSQHILAEIEGIVSETKVNFKIKKNSMDLSQTATTIPVSVCFTFMTQSPYISL